MDKYLTEIDRIVFRINDCYSLKWNLLQKKHYAG